MTPTYARAPRGQRAVGYAPLRGRRVNFILGARLAGLVAPIVYTGTTTTPFVRAYARQALAPAVRAGDIVLVDRHPAHDVATLGRVLRTHGAHLWSLPPYSPDLSPVEFCGSKLKHIVRSREPRSVDACIDAVAAALAMVTPQDLDGWFQHGGYHRQSF